MPVAQPTTTPCFRSCIQEFCTKAQNRPVLRDVPYLEPALLKRARNSVQRSPNNNDLLEFIGDRAVNLLIAVLVDKIRLSKAHHTTVREVVCNNDTLGRLSFYLHFHDHAELDPQDRRDIDNWDPLSADSPPKALADLFEAYSGAVYIQHGWARLESWLEKVFGPIIKAATGAYWLSSSAEQIFGPSLRCPNDKVTFPETRSQAKLLDYIEFKRETLRSQGQEALDALPSTTKFKFDSGGRLQAPDVEMVEVAIHLINIWICKIIITLWPEYHTAIARAAHILSAITGLVISERVMAYMSSVLSLDVFASIGDDKTVDSGSSSSIASSQGPQTQHRSPRFVSTTSNQRAMMLKATIGWFYHSDSQRTTAWGESWFRPIVMRAHDILVDLQGFRPVIPRGTIRNISPTVPKDPLVSLVSGLANMGIKDTSISSTSSHENGSQDQLDVDQDEGLKLPGTLSKKSEVSTPKLSIVVGVKDTTLFSANDRSDSSSPVPSDHHDMTLRPTIPSKTDSHSRKWRPIGQFSKRDDVAELSKALSTLSVELGQQHRAIKLEDPQEVISTLAPSGKVNKWKPISRPSVKEKETLIQVQSSVDNDRTSQAKSNNVVSFKTVRNKENGVISSIENIFATPALSDLTESTSSRSSLATLRTLSIRGANPPTAPAALCALSISTDSHSDTKAKYPTMLGLPLPSDKEHTSAFLQISSEKSGISRTLSPRHLEASSHSGLFVPRSVRIKAKRSHNGIASIFSSS